MKIQTWDCLGLKEKESHKVNQAQEEFIRYEI